MAWVNNPLNYYVGGDSIPRANSLSQYYKQTNSATKDTYNINPDSGGYGVTILNGALYSSLGEQAQQSLVFCNSGTSVSELIQGYSPSSSLYANIWCDGFSDIGTSSGMYLTDEIFLNKTFIIFNSGSSNNQRLAHVYQSFSTSNIGAYYSYTKGAYNTWTKLSTPNYDYYAINVNTNNFNTSSGYTNYITIPLKSGKSYTFTMHTYSESSWDGIIISTTSIGSTSLKDFSDSSTGKKCTGINELKTFSITGSSSVTQVYLYYYTDSSNLSWNSRSIGYVRVYSTSNGGTITLNRNGGTGGNTSISYSWSSNGVMSLPTYTMGGLSSLPSRSGYTFLGYYDTPDHDDTNWDGTQIFGPTGSHTNSLRKRGDITLYAGWKNGISNFTNYAPYDGGTEYISYNSLATTTSGVKYIKISNTSVYCTNGEYADFEGTDTLNNLPSGWEVTSGGMYVKIPSGTGACNTGNMVFRVYSTAGTNYIGETVGLTRSAIAIELRPNSLADLCTLIGDTRIGVSQTTAMVTLALFGSGNVEDISYATNYSLGTSGKISVNNDSLGGYIMFIGHYPDGLEDYDDLDAWTHNEFNLSWTGYVSRKVKMPIMNSNLGWDAEVYVNYSNDTVTYDGDTYYIWERVDSGGRLTEGAYVLTEYAGDELYSFSLEADIDNFVCPYIYQLNEDLEFYAGPSLNEALICIREF